MNVNNLEWVLVLIFIFLIHVRISCHVRGFINRDLLHLYTSDIIMDSPSQAPTPSLQEILQDLSSTLGRLEAAQEATTQQLTTFKQQMETNTKELADQLVATTEKLDLAIATTESNMTQIQNNGEALTRMVSDIDDKLKTLEIRVFDKILKEKADLKVELKDHIKHEIQLSEGAQNNYTKIKIEQSVKDVEDKMLNKIKEVDDQRTTQVDSKIQQLSDRLDVQEDRVMPSSSTGRTFMQIPRSIEDKMPMFSDDKHSSPYGFLKEMESYLKLNHVQPRLHINVISHMMLGKCNEWFKAYQDRFVNLEEFKKMFIMKYCNEDKQDALREKLLKNKYHPKSGYSMTQHCLLQIVHNKNLKDPFTEERLVRIIVRHYDVISQQMIYSRNVTTFMELEKVLEQIDQVHNSEPKNKLEQPKADNRLRENNSSSKVAVNTDNTFKESNSTARAAVDTHTTVPNQRYMPYPKQNKPFNKDKKHVSVISDSKESKNE